MKIIEEIEAIRASLVTAYNLIDSIDEINMPYMKNMAKHEISLAESILTALLLNRFPDDGRSEL